MCNFTVFNTYIRQIDGLYSLNDLHRASGRLPRQKPSEWLRNQQTQDVIAEIQKAGNPAISSKQKVGTYACRELVIAYAAWISPAFHLKVLRVFLDTQIPQPSASKIQLDSDPRFVSEVARQVGEDLLKASLYITPQKAMDVFVLIYADALWHKRMRPAFTNSLVQLLK